MEKVPETMVDSILPKYQVFINHRGPDVKKTLASLIYHRLTHYGLSVFLDENEITPGDTLKKAIKSAINSASVHVAIFSRRYAESIWCLKELHWMLKGKSKIIPVFWDVKPEDPRYILGDWATAFEDHRLKGRVPEAKLKKWQRDLNRASSISGLRFETNEGYLGELVENIAELVFKAGECRWINLEERPKYPVGLHKSAGDFANRCPHSDATTIVVIVGMVGVGKSILAQHLYKMRQPKFGRSSFLKDVKIEHLTSLQKNLLRQMGAADRLWQNACNIQGGKNTLQDFFFNIKNERIFIVLDNVDGIDTINQLLDMDAVPSGSLIFITCRDKDLLRRCFAKLNDVNILVYEVNPLQEKHARQLFCQHAFSQSVPREGFDDLVDQSLQICGGVPLCLQDLGAQFSGNHDKGDWKLQLGTMPRVIRDTLEKICYDSLRRDQKDLFLDIGCFFVGEEKELTIRVLGGSYPNIGECLDSLRKKCLVDYKKREDPMIGYNNSCRSSEIITMPVPLMKLAKDIARTEFLYRAEFYEGQGRPLRLSSSYDIQELSEQAKAKSPFQIRGIRSSKGENPPDFSNRIGDITAEDVRLLVAEGLVDLSSFFNSYKVSGILLWLRLGNLSIFAFPPSISLQKLRVLELEGPSASVQHFIRNCYSGAAETGTSIFRYWLGGGISGFRNWKQQSIFQYLKGVKGMRNLTNLELTNITSLNSLPIDFSQLPNVTHLNLSGCVNLTDLPGTFSELLKLEYLVLQGCEKLRIPPDILGKISTLVYVDFKGCAKLLELPRGIPHQKDLRYLNLLCTGLLELPKDLKLLDKLEQLSIGNPSLQQVIALPSTLVSLHLQHCLGLEKLTSLSNLVNLKSLNIKECFNLQILNVEGLTSLEEIEAQACSKLCSIVGLNQQKSLNCLHVSTENDVIRKEIWEFLTSSSNQKPSTAIFSVKATDDEMAAIRAKMQPDIIEDGNCRILNIVSTQELKDIHLYSAIVMLFITGNGQEDASTSEVCVTFQPARNLFHLWSTEPPMQTVKGED